MMPDEIITRLSFAEIQYLKNIHDANKEMEFFEKDEWFTNLWQIAKDDYFKAMFYIPEKYTRAPILAEILLYLFTGRILYHLSYDELNDYFNLKKLNK